jgi:Ni/Fe-hydrogenase subunit HybB-like protein
VTTAKRFAHTSMYLFLILLVALGLGVGTIRFMTGMGATTNLSDDFPWGLWIVFDLIFCPFSAGAFMIAAVTHIYKRTEYKPIARPVILAGFLGEVSVIVVLLADLGRWHQFYNVLLPWNWNIRSFMFQVSFCLTLYIGVLLMEVAPSILERFKWERPVRMIRPLAILIAGAGTVLSALHQSALGSLFLIMPYKLHPLWWTPLLPLLFFTSAAFGGLAMAILVAAASFRAFHRRLELSLLTDLAKIVAILLGFYLILRVGDLLRAGEIGLLLTGGWLSLLLLVELGLGVVVPLVLFSKRRFREAESGLILGASCVLAGLALNRANVALLALSAPTGAVYIPHWMEVVVAMAAVAAAVLSFALAVRLLPVLPEDPDSQQGAAQPKGARWKLVPAACLFLLLTTVGVLFLRPMVRVEALKADQVSAPSSQLQLQQTSESCQSCHQTPSALVNAGATREDLGRLIVVPEPPQKPHGRLRCVTCHQGDARTQDSFSAHAGLVVDLSQRDPNACLSCHHDLPADFPEDRLRTPHDELVHGEVVNVSCSDCHGGIAHGSDPVSGEVICPMSVCLDCHQARRLDRELTDCDACHIGPHTDVAGTACSGCHQSTETWQEVDLSAHPLQLLGKHAVLECLDCHGGPAFGQARSGCSDCHERPHEFGSDRCGECHNPADAWQSAGAGEQHPFPQEHGGTAIGCGLCHPDSDPVAYSCDSCHSQSQMTQVHNAQGQKVVAGACVLCHPQGETP